MRQLGWVALLLCLTAGAVARELPAGDPQQLGFSPQRLARIDAWYQTQVDAGAVPGAVVAIARRGEVAYLHAIGFQDQAKQRPLQPDAIFWIASMTKPVTSVAAMMLVDDGKLDLDAPVERYLPELADRKVGVERTDPATGKTELVLDAPKRPMTVLDLLRHTSGLVYPDGQTMVHKLYRDTGIFRRDRTLAEFTASLAPLPLAHQPGEVWEYSWGIDVLARVVEVASGQPFDQFLRDRLFGPLGMVDTDFFVPEAKLARLVDPIPGGRPPIWDVTRPMKLLSGGGGLVSTAADYLRFCQMLLSGGELDGVRILAPATVARMTSSQVPADTTFLSEVSGPMGPSVGAGWGLGFAIRTDPDSSVVPGAVGSYTWSGLWGTKFWIDPAQQLVVVQMLQLPPGKGGPFNRALRHLTYASLRASTDGDAAAVAVPPPALAALVGRYDFGQSLSAADRLAPKIPEYGGVGLQFAKVGNAFKVETVFDGAPAARAGVEPGDTIVALDGAALDGLALEPVIAKIRGAIGTPLRLTLRRGERPDAFDVTAVRSSIRVPGAQLQVDITNGQLVAKAVGEWPVLDFELGKPVALETRSGTFTVVAGDHTQIAFTTNQANVVTGAVLNPGPQGVEGVKLN